jgi:hypothetical protein
VNPVLQAAGALLVIGGAIALAVKGVRVAIGLLLRIEEFLDDWRGAPGRPGVAERPGVMQRLVDSDARQTAMEARLGAMESALEEVRHEMVPNSGKSLKDQVTLLAEHVVPPESR